MNGDEKRDEELVSPKKNGTQIRQARHVARIMIFLVLLTYRSALADQGDVDGDGDVDTDDVELLFRQIEGSEDSTSESDVNRDGRMDALDIALVFQLLDSSRRAPIEGLSVYNAKFTSENPIIDGARDSLWDETQSTTLDPSLPYQNERRLGAGPHDDHPPVEARFRFGILDGEPYLFGFIVAPDLYIESGCLDEGGITGDGLRAVAVGLPRRLDRGEDVFLGGLFASGDATGDMDGDEILRAVSIDGTLDDSSTPDDVEIRMEFGIPFSSLSLEDPFEDERLFIKLVWVDHDLSPGACESDTAAFQVRWSGGGEAGKRFDASLQLQLGFSDSNVLFGQLSRIEDFELQSFLSNEDESSWWVAGRSAHSTREVESGLFRSSDKGLTWNAVGSFKSGNARAMALKDSAVYVGSGNRESSAESPEPATIFRVRDEGRLTTLLRLVDDGPGEFSALVSFEGFLYAAQSDDQTSRIWRSHDGVSWVQSLVLADLASQRVRSLTGFVEFDSQLFAGAENGRLYRTEDGVTWSEEIIANSFDLGVMIPFQKSLYIGGSTARSAGPVAVLFRREAPGVFTTVFSSDSTPLSDEVVIDSRVNGIQLAWESLVSGAVIDERLLLGGYHSAQIMAYDGESFSLLRHLDLVDRSVEGWSLGESVTLLRPMEVGSGEFSRSGFLVGEGPYGRFYLGRNR